LQSGTQCSSNQIIFHVRARGDAAAGRRSIFRCEGAGLGPEWHWKHWGFGFVSHGRVAQDGQAELKRWLEQQGCLFEQGKGSHLKVRPGNRATVLPMHGKKEIGKGLEQRIKKDLGIQ